MFLFDFLFLNHWHRRICLGLALTLASWRLAPRIALSLCEHAPTPPPSRRMPQTPRKTSRADDDFDDMMRAARGHHRAAASVPGDITTPPRSRANRRSHPQGMPRPGPGPSSSNSTSSPSTTSIMSSHGRSLSHADAASRHSKRLSLNFPVQPAAASSAVPSIPTPRSRPASWIGTSPVRSPEHPPHSPDANFFTALAAQERRVLELREELSKAEDTLKELKKQWATHEAARLGQKGAYGFHPLQPVDTVLANGLFDDDPDGPSWAEKEMERRRMILNGQRQSNRKVFSGSRHTRTLSLLSPTKPANDAPFSTALDDTLDDAPYPPRGRSSTSPVDSSRERTESQDHTSEALLRTGRQMATDLKDGLITFWGDLRQAAIGDEPAASPPRSTPQQNRRRLTNEGGLSRSRTVNTARRKSKSIHPSGDSSSLIDIESNFWKEHGIEAVRAPQPAVVKPAPTKSPQKTLRSQPSSQTLDEAWDDWDTTEPEKENTKFAPGGHSSSNSSVSELRTSPPESERSSPRTSTSSTTPHLPPQHHRQCFADEQGKEEARLLAKPSRITSTPASSSSSPRHTSASTAENSPSTTSWRALNKLAPSLVTAASSPGSPLRYFLDEWDSIVSSSSGATSPTAAHACMAEAVAWEEYLRGAGGGEPLEPGRGGE